MLGDVFWALKTASKEGRPDLSETLDVVPGKDDRGETAVLLKKATVLSSRSTAGFSPTTVELEEILFVSCNRPYSRVFELKT